MIGSELLTKAQNLVAAFFDGPVWVVLFVLLALICALGWLFLLALGALNRRPRLLRSVTAITIVVAAGMAAWALSLSQSATGGFDASNLVIQVVAIVATLVATFLGALVAGPWALDRLEQSGATGLIASRQMRASRSGFLTIISVLSILGVGVSCFALCATISVMGGFGADLKGKILGNNAHITVDADSVQGLRVWDPLLDEARAAAGVRAATPMVSGEAMASSASNTAGVVVRGVDPETVGQVIDLVKNIEVGDFGFLTDAQALADLPPDAIIGRGPSGKPYFKGGKSIVKSSKTASVDQARKEDAFAGLILGRELAKSLHVLVGDEVKLIAPLGDLGPMGVMPRTRRFRVAAIFYSGMYEYDSTHLYMRLDEAQEFLDFGGRVSSIELKVDDPEKVGSVRGDVTRRMSARASATGAERSLRVRDWKELNRNLFSALAVEKIGMFVVLCIMVAVACFCIICTLLLMVTEKSKEIAIIKAMGASDRMVLRVFMLEGALIGAFGTVLGVVLGAVGALGLKHFGLRLDPEVYYVNELPVEVNPLEYLLVVVCALVITVIATTYPALMASRLRPVDGIRHE